MNSLEPLKINNINLSNIVYPKSRSNDVKKIILIKYNENGKLKNFVFQTPTLLNLFKPNVMTTYAEIEIALVGKEQSKVNDFIQFLNNIENKIKADAQLHAPKWFNIDDDHQTITFQKIIRESETHKNGTIKIKLIKNDDFETLLQLNNSTKISNDLIPEDSWCKLILECYAVWVNSSNDFGIFFRPILVSFIPKEKDIYNYNFVNDSDEDEDEGADIFEVPDTEIHSNIFMKIEPRKSKNRHNNSSTQLDMNELINHLDIGQSDQHINTVDIDMEHIFSRDTDNSKSSKSSKSSTKISNKPVVLISNERHSNSDSNESTSETSSSTSELSSSSDSSNLLKRLDDNNDDDNTSSNFFCRE